MRIFQLAVVSLLFFSPVFIWFLLTASGIVAYEGTQEEYNNTSSIIAMISAGLFLIVGIPFAIPAIWYRRLSERALLTRGRFVQGTIKKLNMTDGITVQVEIEEPDGTKYLTLPTAAEVPEELKGCLAEGVRVPLRVDPSDRYHFVVDWNKLAVSGSGRTGRHL